MRILNFLIFKVLLVLGSEDFKVALVQTPPRRYEVFFILEERSRESWHQVHGHFYLSIRSTSGPARWLPGSLDQGSSGSRSWNFEPQSLRPLYLVVADVLVFVRPSYLVCRGLAQYADRLGWKPGVSVQSISKSRTARTSTSCGVLPWMGYHFITYNSG